MDLNGCGPPRPTGLPPEFLTAPPPVLDSFVQLLQESLQELYGKLLAEYLRTQQASSQQGSAEPFKTQASSQHGGIEPFKSQANQYRPKSAENTDSSDGLGKAEVSQGRLSLLSVGPGAKASSRRTSCPPKQNNRWSIQHWAGSSPPSQRASIAQSSHSASSSRSNSAASTQSPQRSSVAQVQEARLGSSPPSQRSSVAQMQEAPPVLESPSEIGEMAHEDSICSSVFDMIQSESEAQDHKSETSKERPSLVQNVPRLSVLDPSGNRSSAKSVVSPNGESHITFDGVSSRGTDMESEVEREVFYVDRIFRQRGESVVAEKQSKKTMPTMKTVDLDDLLSGVSFHDRSCFDKFDNFVGSPTSWVRVAWELMGAILVLFDLIEIPIQLSFKPEETIITSIMGWVQRLYWTIDCISLFSVGYTTSSGDVIMKARPVIKHYLTTWFALDFFVCFCDWTDYLSEKLGFFSALRSLRVLRLMKVLRASKIVAHLPLVIDTMVASKAHSEGVKLLASTARMMACAALLLHLIACGWHAIGKHSKSHGSGWLHAFYTTGTAVDTSFAHTYLVAYHWSITQLIGSADIYPDGSLERLFAILVLFLAFVISASVVSSITTSMTAIQFITSQRKKQLDHLKKYLVSAQIPSAIASRVLQNATYALEESNRNVQENEVELLQMISEPLYVELHYSMYKDYLCWHPFFAYYMDKNQQALRQISHMSLTQTVIIRGDTLFSQSEQKIQPQMYFFLRGKMVYMKLGCSPVYVGAGDFASEQCLWTKWTHQGGLRATEPCGILCLDAGHFKNTANRFKSGAFWPAVYAQGFVALLNEMDPKELTDINDRWAIDVYSLAQGIFVGEEEAMSLANSTRSFGLGGLFGRDSCTALVAKNADRMRFSQAADEVGGTMKSAERAAAVGAEVAADFKREGHTAGRHSDWTMKGWLSNMSMFSSARSGSNRSGMLDSQRSDSSLDGQDENLHSGALPRVAEQGSAEHHCISDMTPSASYIGPDTRFSASSVVPVHPSNSTLAAPGFIKQGVGGHSPGQSIQ